MKKIFMNILIKLFLILIGLLTIFADFMGVLDLMRNGNIISGNYYLWIFRRNKKKSENEKKNGKEEMLCLNLSYWSLWRSCPDLSFRWYPHLYLMFAKYSKISHCDGNYPSTKSISFWNVRASPFFRFISLSEFRVCRLYMSCRRSCYIRWIMSLHGLRYSSELDSLSCFRWLRS